MTLNASAKETQIVVVVVVNAIEQEDEMVWDGIGLYGMVSYGMGSDALRCVCVCYSGHIVYYY